MRLLGLRPAAVRQVSKCDSRGNVAEHRVFSRVLGEARWAPEAATHRVRWMESVLVAGDWVRGNRHDLPATSDSSGQQLDSAVLRRAEVGSDFEKVVEPDSTGLVGG
ncbi:hypothetical protein MAHJHV29_47390 [Mycobacterium avium subsp. hominissuis]